jgi:transposase
MRTKGSAEALEMRRMIGARLLQEGRGVREVARLLGVAPATVSRWKRALEARGAGALRARLHPARLPKLSADRKAVRVLQQAHRGWLELQCPLS